jgi:hypothetical protein
MRVSYPSAHPNVLDNVIPHAAPVQDVEGVHPDGIADD